MAKTLKPNNDESRETLDPEEKIWYQIVFGKNFDEEFPDGIPEDEGE